MPFFAWAAIAAIAALYCFIGWRITTIARGNHRGASANIASAIFFCAWPLIMLIVLFRILSAANDSKGSQ